MLNLKDLEKQVRTLGSGARLIRHATLSGDVRTAHDFTQALGCSEDRIAKTLLLKSIGGKGAKPAEGTLRYVGVTLALPNRADLRALANAIQADELRLASRDELSIAIDAVPGAVSPFRLGRIPLFVDDRVVQHETVFVGSGIEGVDIEVTPAALTTVTRATVGQFRL